MKNNIGLQWGYLPNTRLRLMLCWRGSVNSVLWIAANSPLACCEGQLFAAVHQCALAAPHSTNRLMWRSRLPNTDCSGETTGLSKETFNFFFFLQTITRPVTACDRIARAEPLCKHSGWKCKTNAAWVIHSGYYKHQNISEELGKTVGEEIFPNKYEPLG